MDTLASHNESITELAAANGLSILPETIKINELGLDFRVAIAEAKDRQRWVLRIPRRPDVMPRATVEGRLLKRVAPHLDVAVPDWRIQSADLIAYPLLPGEPGLTIADDGTPTWHFNEESPTFANSLGEFLARLVNPHPRRNLPRSSAAHGRDDRRGIGLDDCYCQRSCKGLCISSRQRLTRSLRCDSVALYRTRWPCVAKVC